MPGANYMGGRRNAAREKAKDSTGRVEKTFFGQRRLCALSKGLSASKPTQRDSLFPPKSSRVADISLSHARQNIPLNNNVFTSSFVPSPIHISPCTPRSRRRTNKKLEAHSSSSSISKSAVLDALDVSEPMFLRGVLDRILTMPDLAGISRNRTKPTVVTGSQSAFSDESLQRTKRKRSSSDLDEESDSLRNGRPSSSRYAQSYTYERTYTPLQKKRTSFEHSIESAGIDADEVHDSRVASATEVEGDIRSSPWPSQDYRSSTYSSSFKNPSANHTSYSNFDSGGIIGSNHLRLPSSIVFRGLKDGSAKQSIEEPTVYGTLFEQADPWDAIGQILGLSSSTNIKSASVTYITVG